MNVLTAQKEAVEEKRKPGSFMSFVLKASHLNEIRKFNAVAKQAVMS